MAHETEIFNLYAHGIMMAKTFFYYVFMFQPFQVTNSTVSKWKIEAFFFVSTVRAMTFQGWPIFMFYSIVGYHNQINLYSEDEKWSTKRFHNFFGSRKILVSFVRIHRLEEDECSNTSKLCTCVH